MAGGNVHFSGQVLNDALAKAIAFLRREQMPYGEFKTLLGIPKSMSNAVLDSSPFVTSFIIYALSHAVDLPIGDMIDKAAAFLRSEMEFGGVWRYWSSRQHKHARLPPDLDDTSCISYALKVAGEKVPNNLWAFRSGRDSAGRFQTWLLPTPRNRLNARFLALRSIGFAQARMRVRRIAVPAEEDPRFKIMHIDPHDVDPVVNANVLLYLGERAETQAAIAFAIETVRQGRTPFSLYYQEPLTLYYAVARAFRHASPQLSVLREQIVGAVLSRCRSIAPPTPLQAALAASALLTFDGASDAIVRLTATILESQDRDGGWDVYPFYHVLGSRELTTGFCIEVLARLRSRETGSRHLGVAAV